MIAEALVIAPSTVERHVANILPKLGARSRAEIAAWAVRHEAVSNAAPDPPLDPSTPVATGSEPPSLRNAPLALTRFIGRQHDLEELKRILRVARLITLTGAPGIGKTRLSIELAHMIAGDYADGALFIPLASVAAQDQLVNAVCAALGISWQGEHATREMLVRALARGHLLLIVDNCEHIIEACNELVDSLLSACDRLTIVATSRQPLGLAGERVWRIAPLGMPLPAGADEVDTIAAADAPRLFIDRATQHHSEFVLSPENAPSIAALCRRLDGNPLAIELAAARVPLLTLPQILEQLSDRFRLLASRARSGPERHRTLRNAIEWSYDLLDSAEQRVFERVAVFDGEWTLEAAEVVCSASSNPDESVLDLLGGLVDKSLVAADVARVDSARYSMPESLRHYGCERLRARGDEPAVRERHARYFLALAQAADPGRSGMDRTARLDLLELEHDNLRSALSWWHQVGAIERGLRLATILTPFWYTRSHLDEGSRWVTGFVERAGGDDVALRIEGLSSAGALSRERGDTTHAWAFYTEALALARASVGGRAAHGALTGMGLLVEDAGHYRAAEGYHARALEVARGSKDEQLRAGSLYALAHLARLNAQRNRAAELYEQALAIQTSIGDLAGVASSLTGIGLLACQNHDYATARSLCQESLAMRQALGSAGAVSHALNKLAQISLELGDYDAAQAHAEESLRICQELGLAEGQARNLHILGRVAAANGRRLRAVLVLSAGVAQLSRMARPQPVTERRWLDDYSAQVRSEIGSHAFEVMWQSGQALALNEAVAASMSSGAPVGALSRGTSVEPR